LLEEWESGSGFQPDMPGKMPVPQKGLCPVPDEPVDPWHHDVNRMPMYGMLQWGDLFTARQKLALVTLSRLVRELPPSVPEAVRLGMAIVVNRMADGNSSLTRWQNGPEKISNNYSRQALPIVWDYAEANIFADATRSLASMLEWVAEYAALQCGFSSGQVQLADATEHPLPDEAATVWFTDPPYYDAIAYAHCSDFFFVWLKRALPDHTLLADPFDPGNPLTPKLREIVVDSTTTKGHGTRTPRFYEEAMARAFAEGRRVLREDGVGCVVFAHKTTEGWEALLSGLIRGGWTITGSWPIATEMGSRLRARDSAALATSVHLVCRPRPDDAPVGDWASVLRELPSRIGDWMERLQSEGVRGADLVFACIGPALEIFSRYSRVETADGREVKLAEYLEKVWEVVGRAALEQVLGEGKSQKGKGKINEAGGGFEEDARLTALFLWTLQSTNGDETHHRDTEVAEEEEVEDEEDEEDAASSASRRSKGFSLVFDVVRRFAQPLGIDLPKWEGRIIETKKGVVRLMAVSERAKQLFGEDGAEAVADWITEDPTRPVQMTLFLEPGKDSPQRRRGKKATMDRGSLRSPRLGGENQATTLDRVHAAMLLQASGQANALRALLKAEQERGPDFLRLANALSALYPKGSEEKRLLDAMLLAMPR
ncbi:MAG: DUF1156 domain-containing protein, partial [Actinomycetota bacterium]